MAQNTYKGANRPKADNRPRRAASKDRQEGIFARPLTGLPAKIRAGLGDRRLHLTVGFLLVLGSIFLLVACTSHLFTGPADQSVIESLRQTGLRPAGAEIENWLGLVGAWVSERLMFRWLGVSAFWLVPIVFLAGYRLVFLRTPLPLGRTTVFCLFMAFWGSIVLGILLLGQRWQPAYDYLSGGVGYEVALLGQQMIGWGTYPLVVVALLIFIVYFFDVTSLGEGWSPEIARPAWWRLLRTRQPGEVPPPASAQTPVPTQAPAPVATARNAEPLPPADQDEDVAETPISEPSAADKIPDPPTKAYAYDDEEAELEDDEEPAFEHEDEPDFELARGIEETIGDERNAHYDPTLELSEYRYPTLDLFLPHATSGGAESDEDLRTNKNRIVETLLNYKIGIENIKATIGPTVTLYEIIPEAGVRISKIKNLEDDIALSLAALGIRIIAPIPGRGTIGIEVPNRHREVVSIRSLLETKKFLESTMELPLALGKTISNEAFVVDLAKMPHLLMAGATGQGKSVGLNVLIASLLYKKHPSQLKFVLVDPKKVELSLFSRIEKHYLAKLPDGDEAIITDTKKVIHTLNSLCIEMDLRYDLLKLAGCRQLKEYNQKFIERRLNPEKGHRHLPYIVLIIDELADLMMTAGKEVETPIARLAQLARAIGIHLVVATQRPSVNVITGIIKANFPARISFKVTSRVDSRTILDTGGAEQLVGMGDMLLAMGSDLTRLQCAFIDTQEVDDLCDYIGDQPGYPQAYELPEYEGESGGGGKSDELAPENRDDLFADAARLIVTHQQGSTSLIQRRLKLGYNRAGRLVDQLHLAGIIGPFEGSKAREVLVKDLDTLEQLLKDLDD